MVWEGEQSLEGGEEASHVDMWGKEVAGEEREQPVQRPGGGTVLGVPPKQQSLAWQGPREHLGKWEEQRSEKKVGHVG